MKDTVKTELSTKWGQELNLALPLKDYPRPNLVRASYFCLNGKWDFAISKSLPDSFTEKILVPFAPECAMSGIKKAPGDDELLYYKRSFTLPSGFVSDRLILHFGAVDQECTVYINGKEAGKNYGGYIPFSFDITELVSGLENEVLVICKDSLDLKYPYGKQTKKRGGMWYTSVSGIWQTVWLESLPKNAVKSLKISQDMNGASIKIDTDAKNKELTLLSSGEKFIFTENEIRIEPKDKKFWTPDTPYLYRFKIKTETDEVESYFALREIGTKTDGGACRLTLNGEPYLFHGVLDQGYFPDGLFTPASYDAFRFDIEYLKSAGFNMLRKHIKIEPQIFYYLCDTLGMVVFQDMVNNSDYSFLRDTALPTVGFKRLSDKRLHRNETERDVFLKCAEDTVKLLYNHPSVLYYTIFNEGWGQFTADKVYKRLKSLDKSRIFDATSGWFWQKESDVNSHHVYFKKVKVKPNEKIPTVISEFGGYSYRVPSHVFGENNYGYKSFKNPEMLKDAVVNLYENELSPLVERGVSALVYTQISDVEDETNGFLSYDRRVEKIDRETLLEISENLQNSFRRGLGNKV
jgi:hypothetical protein